MEQGFYRWQGDVLELRIYVQPRASRDEIIGLHGNNLKIRITTPPVDGKANAHLLKYLSKCFAVPRRQIELIQGIHSRNKVFRIQAPQQLPEGILARSEN